MDPLLASTTGTWVTLVIPFDNKSDSVPGAYRRSVDDWIGKDPAETKEASGSEPMDTDPVGSPVTAKTTALEVDARVLYLYKRQRIARAPKYKSPEWLAERATRINGSEIASMMGKNKYENVVRYWKKKTGQIPRDFGVSQFMVSWGNKYEQEAMDVYAWLTDTAYIINNTGSVVHAKQGCEHLAATPDFIVVNGVLVEIKCPRTRKIEHGIPTHYYPQLQLQLAVTGLEECHFTQYRPPSLDAGGQMDILVVKYDPLWFEMIEEPTRKFSRAIQTFYDRLGLPPGSDTRDVHFMDVRRAEAGLLEEMQEQAMFLKDYVPDFVADKDLNSGQYQSFARDHPRGPKGPEEPLDTTEVTGVTEVPGVTYFKLDVISDVPIYTNTQYSV